MIDMTTTIAPKSDQMNSDDLIGRTLTVTVKKVELLGGEQPVAIHYEGDNGKPYKPGKSMRRVMVQLWGGDAAKYTGRRMTLFRDPDVQFGGAAVGGIRISHMSDIGDKPVRLMLTATRANKKPFIVQPLVEAQKTAPQPEFDASAFMALVDEKTASATTADELKAWWDGEMDNRGKLHAMDPDKAAIAKRTVTDRLGMLVAGAEV